MAFPERILPAVVRPLVVALVSGGGHGSSEHDADHGGNHHNSGHGFSFRYAPLNVSMQSAQLFPMLAAGV